MGISHFTEEMNSTSHCAILSSEMIQPNTQNGFSSLGFFCFPFQSFSTKQLVSVSFLDSDCPLDSSWLNNILLHFLKFFFLTDLFAFCNLHLKLLCSIEDTIEYPTDCFS